jgi:hypothetical protein
MAIQLNDRDHLIFKLIDEHQVLLEKHISWFISGDDKPVLIRDRLRKLFYLDYLLCHRHGTKLPWWTTPTKPLVYMNSPMTKSISGFTTADQTDLFDANVQRHLLEVANLRMLHLVDVRDGLVTDFEWTTIKPGANGKQELDAKVSFKFGGKTHKLGIVNHPECGEALIKSIESALQHGVDSVLIVSRDEAHQMTLQKLMAGTSIERKCVFSTHHDLYKTGIVNAPWLSCDAQKSSMFCCPTTDSKSFVGNFQIAQAIPI